MLIKELLIIIQQLFNPFNFPCLGYVPDFSRVKWLNLLFNKSFESVNQFS